MSEMQNIAAAASAAQAALPRYDFAIEEDPRVPGSLSPTDPKKVTLRRLTYSEEKAALSAINHGGHAYEYEGAMRALDAVDGKTVTWEADEKQRVWESFSPVVRDLLASGFLRYCLPTPGQRANFLASVKIRFPNGG
jgi:hypothetical protein